MQSHGVLQEIRNQLSLGQTSRENVRRHLFTAGELLRSDELEPDLEAALEKTRQFDLFARPAPIPGSEK